MLERGFGRGGFEYGRVLRTDQVSALEVEAVQLVAGLLRIHDILVDDESGALGVGGNALADLSVECVSRGSTMMMYSATMRERTG